MYCEKCGKQLPENMSVCPDCAADTQALFQEEQPYSAQEQGFALNFDGVAPKKRSNKGIIIGIIAVLAVIAVAAVVLCWDAILGMFGVMRFDTPQEHFTYVEMQAAEKLTDRLLTGYDSAMDQAVGGMQSEVHVLLGDDLLSLLQSSLVQSGVDMDLDWLKDIAIQMDVSKNESEYQIDAGVGLGDTRLLTLRALGAMSEYVMYLTIPEMTEDFLMLDIAELGDLEPEQSRVQAMNDMITRMPSQESLEELVGKYLQIVLQHIDQVEESTQTVTVGGLSQQYTVLTAKINEEHALNIAIAVLEEMRQDAVIKSTVENLSAYINEQMQQSYELSGEEYTPVDAYENLCKQIDESLEDLRAQLPDCDRESYLILSDYINEDHEIIGRELTSTDSTDESICYFLVSQEDAFAFELSAQSLSVIGDGTKTDGTVNGQYTLSFENTAYAKLEVADWNEAAGKGTLRIKPTSELLKEMFPEGDVSAMLGITDIALVLELDSQENAGYCAMKLMAGEKLLVGLTMDAQLTQAAPMAIPEKSVDISNQEALLKLIQELDASQVLENMKAAGIPEEYVQLVKYLVDSLQNELSYQ